MVYRYNKPPSQRQLRVAESIRRALSDVFTFKRLSHPFFDKIMITISEVRISGDLKLATAFINFHDDVDKDQLIKLLNEISPHIKKLIADKITVRFLPQIRFVYDKSFDYAQNIEKLL